MNDKSGLIFRFRDTLPKVCVVCGTPASGHTSIPVNLPTDRVAKQMTLLQLVSFILGFAFFWNRSAARTPENQWLGVPTCGQHKSAKEVARTVAITAKNRHQAEFHGGSPQFRQALEAFNAPPSEEFLASLDAGPAKQTDDFLNQIDKSSIESPGDFLKGLGQKPDAP